MPTGTFLDLSKHFFVTLIIAFFLWIKYHNLKLILIAFIIGQLIDIDHIFDFQYYVRKVSSSETAVICLMDFFNPGAYVKATGKVFVLLHGWEYLLILGLIAQKLRKKLKGISYALILPYFFHLLIDQSPFFRAPLAYFFFIRLINNFSLSTFNGH